MERKGIKRWYLKCPFCGYENAYGRCRWFKFICLNCGKKIREANKNLFKERLKKEMLK